MTETSIQNRLYHKHRKNNHDIIIPNCGLYDWESDMIVVPDMAKALTIEYEIKVTKADFKRDQKKERHETLLRAVIGKGNVWPASGTGTIPNRFFYAAPEGLLTPEDIPPYAGLIVWTQEWGFRITKPAPWLHRNHLPANRLHWLSRGLMLRYWQQRMKVGHERLL